MTESPGQNLECATQQKRALRPGRGLEEASKRDHKKIGKEMDYMIDELIGKGLPVWLPNGEVLKSEIERFAVETEGLRVCKSHNPCSRQKGTVETMDTCLTT